MQVHCRAILIPVPHMVGVPIIFHTQAVVKKTKNAPEPSKVSVTLVSPEVAATLVTAAGVPLIARAWLLSLPTYSARSKGEGFAEQC